MGGLYVRSKKMLVYIAILALVCFWFHAQLRCGLGARLISSGLLIAVAAGAVSFTGRLSAFYQRGAVAAAIETLVTELPIDERREYEEVLQEYKLRGSAFSLKEAFQRLKARDVSETNKSEQADARQPTTAPDSKSEGKEKPKPESKERSQ
jgi:hypothetical protein